MAVQIPAARIYNLPTARMYSIIWPSDSPPGGGRTVPRTVSRTALREDLRKPNGHSDSPSGGLTELGPSLGQPFGRHSRTAPRALRSKLRPLYRVAHIQCHLSGRASPSRISSCRNPDSLSALRNYFAGREREGQIMHGLCMLRKRVFGQPPPPLFIGDGGVEGLKFQPHPSMSSPRYFGAKAQKGGFPKSNPKSTFTIHDDIFQRPFELKIFMWA